MPHSPLPPRCLHGKDKLPVLCLTVASSALIRIAGLGQGGQITGQLLAADSPRATNSVEQPDRVAPVAPSVHRDGDASRVKLPLHSIATMEISSQ